MAFEREGFQSREEAAFVAESGGVVVVRVAGFPVGKNDSARAQFADHASHG